MDQTYITNRQADRSQVTHYIKKYPDRYKLIQYKIPYSLKLVPDTYKKGARTWSLTEDEILDNIDESIQRTKTRITDLTICNDFDLFVTLTLNCIGCVPKCINKPCTCDKSLCTRYDLDYAIRTVKAWHNNQIKRYGRFPHLQVMELHKDNGYHFHALFKDYPGKLRYWRADRKDGRSLYNLVSYRKGWTTAKKIYDISGTSSYVRKYITKDMPRYPDKKRYWCSQGLNRPIIVQDPELMLEILENPGATTWIPPEGATLRINGSIKSNSSNVSSITTLMVDNAKDYYEERETIKNLNIPDKDFYE